MVVLLHTLVLEEARVRLRILHVVSQKLARLARVHGHEPLEHANILACDFICVQLRRSISRLVVKGVLEVKRFLMRVD